MNEFIGTSSWTHRIRELIGQVAPTDCSVLITGPSGTGKEVIARAIHAGSRRHNGPRIAVNCSSVCASLFASQLFGHVKGAFTGADSDARGYFHAAEHGTLFLDEIGELPLELQPQLLRVIEERTVAAVGNCREIPVDVRIVAATNRDLRQEVAAGRFREDLYHRLNAFELTTLPLSQHPEDIAPLSDFFLRAYAPRRACAMRLSAEAMRTLEAHEWPGNARELRNILQRAVILNNGAEISAEQVAGALGRDGGAALAVPFRVLGEAAPLGDGLQRRRGRAAVFHPLAGPLPHLCPVRLVADLQGP